MAIMKVVRILLYVISDGTTDTFTVKLATDGDPYWVAEQHPAGYGGHIANWFANPNAANAPKGAKMVTGALSVGLAIPTSVLTIKIDPKPNGTRQDIQVDLLFA